MIKHIVFFKLKDEADGLSGADNRSVLEKMLKALPDKIDVIAGYEVGIDIIKSNPAYDLVLYSAFKSIDDLIIYRDHPEHQHVLAFINRVVADRAVVDYEVR